MATCHQAVPHWTSVEERKWENGSLAVRGISIIIFTNLLDLHSLSHLNCHSFFPPPVFHCRFSFLKDTMKLLQLAAIPLLALRCYGSPLQERADGLVERQNPGPGSYFAITGATGGVHPRLEIRDLEKTGQMWNLFLLAMKGFQDMDQKSIASWYQIAGEYR